jgi:NAD(P)-dependent dehydrogenase (short-subunit alcohol dehydrogenase family)
MEKKLNGKIAIVTGGGQGIGKAVAVKLAEAGATVIVADVNEKTASATANEIRSSGANAKAFVIDLSDVGAIKDMASKVAEEFAGIDILVNNAGVVQTKPFLEITEEEWDRIIDINQKGVFFCMQAVAEQMIRKIPDDVKSAGRSKTSYGKMVNLSSISGRRGRDVQPHYGASKAAVISLTQSAALAFAPYNINVNAIAPGVVHTPMWDLVEKERSRLMGGPPGTATKAFEDRIPLKRLGKPENMADAIVFLCSPDADYITGQTLNVDGGYEMD